MCVLRRFLWAYQFHFVIIIRCFELLTLTGIRSCLDFECSGRHHDGYRNMAYFNIWERRECPF